MKIEQHKTASRKTAAKQRYNEKHYDQIKFSSPKGTRAIIRSLAAASGQSMAEYMRMLVIRDAMERGFDLQAVNQDE